MRKRFSELTSPGQSRSEWDRLAALRAHIQSAADAGRPIKAYLGCGFEAREVMAVAGLVHYRRSPLFLGVDLKAFRLARCPAAIRHPVILYQGEWQTVLKHLLPPAGKPGPFDDVSFIAPRGTWREWFQIASELGKFVTAPTVWGPPDFALVRRCLKPGGELNLVTENRSWADVHWDSIRKTFLKGDRLFFLRITHANDDERISIYDTVTGSQMVIDHFELLTALRQSGQCYPYRKDPRVPDFFWIHAQRRDA